MNLQTAGPAWGHLARAEGQEGDEERQGWDRLQTDQNKTVLGHQSPSKRCLRRWCKIFLKLLVCFSNYQPHWSKKKKKQFSQMQALKMLLSAFLSETRVKSPNTGPMDSLGREALKLVSWTPFITSLNASLLPAWSRHLILKRCI